MGFQDIVQLIADVVANYGQEMIDIFNRVTI